MAAQGPLPSPGNVLKCSLAFTESGGIRYSAHFYLGYTGTRVTQTDANSIATAMGTNWTTGMRALFASDVILANTYAQDLVDNQGVVGSAAPGLAGTNAGSSVEAGTSIHLRFKTSAHYRGGHPGIYLPPGVGTEVVQPSSWNAALQTAVITGWNALISGLAGLSLSSAASLTQVAVSYYKGPVTNTDPSPWVPKNVPKQRTTPVVLPVVSVSVTPIIGSQRRRRQSTGA